MQTRKCRQRLAIYKFRRKSADIGFVTILESCHSCSINYAPITSSHTYPNIHNSVKNNSKQRGIHCLCFDNLYEGMLDPFLKARFHPLLKTSLTFLIIKDKYVKQFHIDLRLILVNPYSVETSKY